MSSFNVSRRTVLRGLGASLALPWMESLLPRGLAADSAKQPLRMAFLYVPNGMRMESFSPSTEGKDFELTELLKPLAPYRDEMLVLSGLTLDKARANGDGPGDHARALGAFLTCSQPKKTHGADIKAGVSVDQVAAKMAGSLTKFPSLEIGCDAGAQSGNCDSGYSCAYSANIAWQTESSPLAKETNPKLVFERLFTDTGDTLDPKTREKRNKLKKSILDIVRGDAEKLNKKVGGNDRRKLDEYYNTIREIELRIERAQRTIKPEDLPPHKKPENTPDDYAEHIRLLGDMMVLAFQTDMTRVSTFVFANEGSNRSYSFIDVPEGHHDLSHHGKDEKKLEKIQKINSFHMEQLAYIIGKLKEAKEGSGSVLDNTMLVYGSGIGDGDRHNHDELPILLFGKGGGSILPGRHLRYEFNTPIANLYLSMLDRIGAPTDQLGDSTGRLDFLDTEKTA